MLCEAGGRFDDVELDAFVLVLLLLPAPPLFPLPAPLLEALLNDFVDVGAIGASAQYTMCVLTCSHGRVYVV